MVGKVGDGKCSLHMKTVGVELVLASGHEHSLGQLLLINNLGDMVQSIADGLAHFGCESVLVVDHGHDEDGALAGDLEQDGVSGGREDDLRHGG